MSNTAWPQQLLNLARREPAKAAVLAVLTVAMGGLWVRLLGSGVATPRSAAGSLVAVANATDNLRGTESPSEAQLLNEWLNAPIAPAGRNLFAVQLDFYPQDGSRVDRTPRPPVGNGFWDELSKSMTAKADQQKERQILIENLQLQAQQLQLQSTMMGPRPTALINGVLSKEGDVVASFRVLQIEARRIIVEREGIRLEILMK